MKRYCERDWAELLLAGVLVFFIATVSTGIILGSKLGMW
jgi:hypothetical protein